MLTSNQEIYMMDYILVAKAHYSYSSALRYKLIVDVVLAFSSLLSFIAVHKKTKRSDSQPKMSFYLYLLLVDGAPQITAGQSGCDTQPDVPTLTCAPGAHVMMALAISGCSAATTVGFIALQGVQQPGISWAPICHLARKFCGMVTFSIVSSYEILKALPTKWRPKVTTIEESKDLSTLPLDELISNLKVYEVVLEKDSEISKVKKEKYKSLTLKERKVSSDEEVSCSESDDEEYAMAIRDFKKFFRRREKFVRQLHDDKKNFRKIKEEKRRKKIVAEGDLRKFSDIGACLSTIDNDIGVTSPESTTQTLPSFEEYTLPVTYPEEIEKTLGTSIEVEPLNETKLEEVGLNCNHKTPLSSKEVPSFDRPEPQPLLTSIDDPKRHYRFKPGLLGKSISLGVDISNWEMFDDDWGLESKEVSPLGEELSLFDRPNEVERGRILEAHRLESILQQQISQRMAPSHHDEFVYLFKMLEKDRFVTYKLELPQELSRVHNTFHVSNVKKCYSDEPLAVPLKGLHIDDKLHFVEDPVEIMDREVKWLKQSRIPIVKVRWNSRRGPGFTWEREDQFQKKYPHLFTKPVSSSSVAT
ncbi:putative reverse transcriptase domain-containing protein [Tanacetum coccineum]